SFFATYANIDGWAPGDDEDVTHVLDRWILTTLDSTVDAVTRALDDFDVLSGASAIAEFVDDLSNWYVRRSRPRFWGSSDRAAHATLYRCLVTTSQLLAPFCPFVADDIYVRLTGELSVHASDWPQPAGGVDGDLLAAMQGARHLVGLGRAARTDAKVRVRQSLKRALLVHPPDVRLTDEVGEQIK